MLLSWSLAFRSRCCMCVVSYIVFWPSKGIEGFVFDSAHAKGGGVAARGFYNIALNNPRARRMNTFDAIE